MAITDKLQSFAFIGIKNFVIRDKSTKAVKCSLPNLVNIGLSDEQSQEFLRGSYGNPKLLTLYGDRDCELTAQTATQTTDLIAVMSNVDVVVKTKPELQIETIDISGGKFTLKLVPTAGVTPTIYKIDANGKEVKPALVAGTPATNATDYSIATKDITCHASVTKIKVYYDSDVEVETIEMVTATSKNWEGIGLLVAKEIETGNLYKAWIKCPNMSITPSTKIGAKNDTGAPDPVDLTISLMVDSGLGYPYSLDFVKEV